MKWSWTKRFVSVVIAAGLVVGSAGAVQAGSERSGGGLVRLQDLQDGMEFDSLDGSFHFSNFEFTTTGLEDHSLSSYLVAPRDDGFRFVLGFGSMKFGAGSTLEMNYQVTLNDESAITGASIPHLELGAILGDRPFAEVELSVANGVADASTSGGAVQGSSTWFDAEARLEVSQMVQLSGAEGIVQVQNGFARIVPEPGTGALMLAGLGAWGALHRRRSA